MQNRFGIKDFFLFLLIAGLIVVVIMAMVQFDRQYQEILTIKQQNSELTRDLVQIKRQIAQGVPVAGGGVGTIGGSSALSPLASDQQQSPFRLILEAEKMQNFSRGDWLVDNFGTKVGKLTPLTSSDVYQKWVEFQVMEGMAWRDPYTLEFVPLLASSWDVSEDGLTMRFHLRRGVTFSDGEPLSADDVVFTFNWVRNPAVAADRDRAYLTKLKDVKKLDDYTVEFTFTEAYYLNFETIAAMSILPEHFYSRFTPDEFNEKTGLLMGTGPYRLENPESWTPGQQVALLRNDRYWGVAATFNRIIFHEIQEEAPQMVLYGNQEHDVIRCTPDQFVKLTNDERVMRFSNKYAYESVFKGYLYVGWNQLQRNGTQERKTFFADKRVRQAMTMLLDRERMIREIFHGFYTVASGPFAPNGPQSAPDVQPWPYAPERAAALLKEAGFADRDGNGVLESPDGEPFRFTLTYPSGSESWEKVTLFAKDAYARAGIIMEADRVDWPVLVDRLNTSNFEAVTLGWSRVVESDPYQVFHSDAMKGQGDNRIAYTNPELDRTIEKARTTMDKEKRMKLWHEVHRILHEDQPYTFLFNRPQLTLMNSRIKNVEKSKLGLNFELLNGGVIPWFVPESKQRYTR